MQTTGTTVLLTKHYKQPQQIRMLCRKFEPFATDARYATNVHVIDIGHVQQGALPPRSRGKGIPVEEDIIRFNKLARTQETQVGDECECHAPTKVDVMNDIGNDIVPVVSRSAPGAHPPRQPLRRLAAPHSHHVKKV